MKNGPVNGFDGSPTGFPAQMTSSMHNDLERGNRLEVQWLSGDVVARGKAAAIPTPVNRAIHDVLALYANGTPSR